MKKRKEGKKYSLLVRLLVLVVLIVIIGFYIANKKDIKENESGNLYSLTSNSYNLFSSSAPALVNNEEDNNFEIMCNYGVILPCISANHNEKNCSFLRYEGRSAIFRCVADKTGIINNYCNIIYYAGDNRCSNPRKDKIAHTEVSGINYSYTPENYSQSNNTNSTSNNNSSINSSQNPQLCYVNWKCSSWSNCTNNQQTRICGDKNNCSNQKNKPAEIKSCVSDCNSNEKNYCYNDYIVLKESCIDNQIVSEKKICPNGCKDGKCIINVNDAKTRKNTLVFTGIYPQSAEGKGIPILYDYVNRFSSNINGLGICCFEQSNSKELVNFSHHKGFIVQAGAGSKEEAMQVITQDINILIFDEIKSRENREGRKIMSGSEFNSLKNELKKINPDIKVGIVEGYESDFNKWHNEGANPDIVGYENYYKNNGKLAEGLISYENFMNNIAPKFPNSKTEAWINRIDEIKKYLGKIDFIVFFAVDSYKLGVIESNWPEFRFEDSENELKAQYGMAELVSSSAPNSAYIGDSFEIKCDFGAKLPCVSAKHEDEKCYFVKFDKTSAIFNCKAVQLGLWNNYCSMFSISGDNRCFDKEEKIQGTEVKICTPNCVNKKCGDDGCGNSCGECDKNYDCYEGICYYPCNFFEKVWSWFGFKDC